MSKFIPVSGPLTTTDPTIDSLDNIRVNGVPGYYPALQDGDAIFVVTPDEKTWTYRTEVRNPRPPQSIPDVVYPKYSSGNTPYTGNICFILAGASGGTGTSGSSGSSGTSGVGTSGSSGSSGSSGTSHPGITSGTSGVSGTAGSSGSSGTAGSSGTSGSRGTSGTSGTSGVGTSGSSGTSGSRGTSGSSGTSGLQGAAGEPGTSGSSGTSGDGTSGSSGTSGDGTSGSSGSSGTGGGPGSSGALILGLPTDGDWSTGIGGFTENTSVADAIDVHDEILALIAPARPGLLTSSALTLSNTTLYSAKLPSGLAAAWYKDGKVAGGSITDYAVDNTFRLTSPSPSTSFYNGSYNDPQGTLQLTQDTAAIDSISTAATGSSTMLTVSSVAVYNSIWSKANAYADVTQSSEGHRAYTFKHTLAGETNSLSIRYDNSNPAPAFAVTPSVVQGTPVWKYLSGIQYYGNGSTLSISFTANNLFNKCYHPTQVAAVTMTPAGFSTQSMNPVSTPAYTDQFVVTSYTLTLNQVVASNAATVRTTLYKPDGTTIYNDQSVPRRVCTYGTVSTTTSDTFFDEAQRLVLNTLTSWTSTATLVNGNAQVRNGVLQYPDTTDYPGFSGVQEYQRNIAKTSASTGSLTFTGITYSQISSYGTGNLNVLLQLDTDGQYFDLGRAVGSNNGNGDGTSRANSKGALTSGSGGVVNWSFGTYSTFSNNNRYRVIIIFRNSTLSITGLVGA